eukprot:g30356.t1
MCRDSLGQKVPTPRHGPHAQEIVSPPAPKAPVRKAPPPPPKHVPEAIFPSFKAKATPESSQERAKVEQLPLLDSMTEASQLGFATAVVEADRAELEPAVQEEERTLELEPANHQEAERASEADRASEAESAEQEAERALEAEPAEQEAQTRSRQARKNVART